MHAHSGLGTAACVKMFMGCGAAFTPAYSTNHLGPYRMYDDSMMHSIIFRIWAVLAAFDSFAVAI